MSSAAPQLLVVVEVPQSDRILCQSPGCNHPVFKRIHVVRHDSSITVLGSECFKKLYGLGPAIAGPRYGSSEGRKLTEAERALLRENTAALIEQLEAEYQQAILAATRAAPRASKSSRFHDLTVPPAAIADAEAQVKREMRAQGLDPDAAGWRGLVDSRVEEMLGLPTLTLHRLRNKTKS